MKNNGKKTSTLLLILIVLLTNTIGVYSLETQSISIVIDGEVQTYDVNPIIINSRTLVPMRGIFETLGATLEWDSESRTAKATKDALQVSVKIGSKLATKKDINLGEEVLSLDVEPMIKDSRTMVPLRFISESFGAEVKWVDDTRTVVINTSNYINSEDDSEDSSTEGVLTYDGAIEVALENSYSLKDKELAYDKAEESYDDLYLAPGSYNSTVYKSKQGLRTAKDWAEKQVDIQKELIEYDVINAMNNIELLKKELEVKNVELANNQEKLRISELKTEYGLESEFNLDVERDSREELLKEKELLELSLIDAYTGLNNLLAKEDGERYEVETNIVYKPLEDIDIEELIKDELNKNPDIWYLEEQIKNADLEVKLYEYNVGQESYTIKRINVADAKNTLKQTKDSLDKSLRSTYNQIMQLQENYNKLKIKLSTAQKSLDVVTKQYQLGMVIELDVKQAELAVEQIKFNMDKLEADHEKLVKLLYKPHLAPGQGSN